jgi:L-ascorbate metabolism protein UlaG (beta-lactamase superfamily)
MVNGFRIRSFGVGCSHEIVLPNGKHIVIDPFYGHPETPELNRDMVEGADYILLTHTHFDHDLQSGYLAKKFKSKVFVGALSALDWIRFHRVPYDNVFPVLHGQKYTLEDFTLEAWTAKHNSSGGRTYRPEDDICEHETGVTGHIACDNWGSIESLDYMITTKNGMKLFIVSGRIVWDDVFDICRQQSPDVILRQSGFRKSGGDIFTGTQVEPKELAEIFSRYHTQLMIPFHFDVLRRHIGAEKTREYFENVKKELENLDPGCTLLYPETAKWYQIGLSIEE